MKKLVTISLLVFLSFSVWAFQEPVSVSVTDTLMIPMQSGRTKVGSKMAFKDVPLEAQSVVVQSFKQDDMKSYKVKWFRSNEFQNEQAILVNRQQNFKARTDGETLNVVGTCQNLWYLNLKLKAYGYKGNLKEVLKGQINVEDNKLEIDHGNVLEWYVNSPKGLKQNFTVKKSPEEVGETLIFKLAVDTNLQTEMSSDHSGILLKEKDKIRFRYEGLIVKDSLGQDVPARLKLQEDNWIIQVETANVSYPLLIDPILTEDQKISASNGLAGDRFGWSVDISQNVIVVGAPCVDGNNTNTGMVYVFRRQGSTWVEEQRLFEPNGGFLDEFGKSVAVSVNNSDQYIAVGAPRHGSLGQGTVYTYRYDPISSTWTLDHKIVGPTAAALFGWEVEITDVSALGVPLLAVGEVSQNGKVYVYNLNTKAFIYIFPGPLSFNSFFGSSISMSSELIAVGSPAADTGPLTNTGAVYIYRIVDGHLLAIIFAFDKAAHDNFGTSVALSKDNHWLVVGSPDDDDKGIDSGSVYIYDVSRTFNFLFHQKITTQGVQARGNFGHSVACTKDTIVVGANNRNYQGIVDSGIAYEFLYDGNSWVEEDRLIASDIDVGDNFGFSVALRGETAVVGSIYDDDNGPSSGSAYIFRLDAPLEHIIRRK